MSKTNLVPQPSICEGCSLFDTVKSERLCNHEQRLQCGVYNRFIHVPVDTSINYKVVKVVSILDQPLTDSLKSEIQQILPDLSAVILNQSNLRQFIVELWKRDH